MLFCGLDKFQFHYSNIFFIFAPLSLLLGHRTYHNVRPGSEFEMCYFNILLRIYGCMFNFLREIASSETKVQYPFVLQFND